MLPKRNQARPASMDWTPHPNQKEQKIKNEKQARRPV